MEPLDPLTRRVWELKDAARNSPLSRQEVIEELLLSVRRDLAYLLRRKRRGHQTAYDEWLERALEVRARALVLLEQAGEPEERH